MQYVLLSLPVLLLAFSVHEFMHAYVALKQGDDTAYMLGRVTLDPRAHIDPIGSILFPLIGAISGAPLIGWAKPTPTTPRKYRKYVRGDVLVSLAGVAGNFLLILLFALLHVVAALVFRATGGNEVLVTADKLFVIGVELNFFLILFNLIPVPPLDGSHVLYHLLPANLGSAYRQLSSFGFIILYALIFTGALNRLFLVARPLGDLFLVPGDLVAGMTM
ncbi:site-2 protease family protein [Longimicrobium sp.]|uniref:site-2 protease family protein n=1 Tax=Longimicrobium sp. TaxID=2029185 RepID=UPI002D080C2A|nr:site-2 protease family protein [Longimicrobium sp.]HSU12461.1 site-2 protease family protein [Longimicrobium sp.]